MDGSSIVPLQGELLLGTQLKLVAPTTVAGTLYGIGFALFCLYVHSLAPRFCDKDRKRQAKFMLVYSSVIMLLGLYNLIANAWITQNTYIEHNNPLKGSPEGPYIYQETIPHSPLLTTLLTCQMVISAFTSAIQIWHVWVIWSATRFANLVIVLPSLCFLTLIALYLRTIIVESTLLPVELQQLNNNAEIVGFAIQAAVTILCTMLISLYLIFHHWYQRKSIGKVEGSNGYTNVIIMLIESYALESIWGLIVTIIWHFAVAAFFIEFVHYIQIIAYLLVQYRVARGTAYEPQRSQRNISSLRWNHTSHATTHYGETSELHSGPHVSANPEASGAFPASDMA